MLQLWYGSSVVCQSPDVPTDEPRESKQDLNFAIESATQVEIERPAVYARRIPRDVFRCFH